MERNRPDAGIHLVSAAIDGAVPVTTIWLPARSARQYPTLLCQGVPLNTLSNPIAHLCTPHRTVDDRVEPDAPDDRATGVNGVEREREARDGHRGDDGHDEVFGLATHLGAPSVAE